MHIVTLLVMQASADRGYLLTRAHAVWYQSEAFTAKVLSLRWRTRVCKHFEVQHSVDTSTAGRNMCSQATRLPCASSTANLIPQMARVQCSPVQVGCLRRTERCCTNQHAVPHQQAWHCKDEKPIWSGRQRHTCSARGEAAAPIPASGARGACSALCAVHTVHCQYKLVS